jgi:hypothetical protein
MAQEVAGVVDGGVHGQEAVWRKFDNHNKAYHYQATML